jgi:Zn-dependent protease with chaperone function
VIISCFVPFAIVVAFGLLAPPLSRRVRPRLAIWILSAGGLLLTTCLLASVSVVVALGVGQLEPFAQLGHWSTRVIGMETPYKRWWIWTATVVLFLAISRAVVTIWSQGRRLSAAWSASQVSPGGLVVMDDTQPFAYAVPGWPGRIVVSRGLLRDLDGQGRRAVLTHEQTHLSERHDLHQLVTAVSTSLNPILFRSSAALRLACERRADEVAARAVGDRRAVARAIATAACPQVDTLVWQASGADVPFRVEALLSQRYENRITSVASLVAVALAVAGSAASVLWLGHDLHNVLVAARR